MKTEKKTNRKTSRTKKTDKTKKAKKTKKKTAETTGRRKQTRNPMKTFITSALVVMAVGYVATATYLYINQRKFLYFPPQGVLPTSEQTVEIQSGTVTLRGWVVNEDSEDAVIYFGGNAERPEASLEDFKYLFNNQAVYIINYRGYGESDGSPTEKNLCSDAMAIYDRVVLDHNNISVIGRSLGSGVAVYLATQRKVHRLVLVTPFNCLADIAQGIYPVFPMRLIMKDKYDSEQIASVITAQTLIIRAENDEVIPAESTDRLISVFNKNYLETAIIPEAGHNNIQDYTQYYMLLRDFINRQ
ncbi:MAG: alpha/beta hydrolase [Candidatus Fermentibacteraceae bacterium]|nr:alpha/beta hydrolase [Candidatus Fermentibacteraceae bacterium]